MHDFEDKALGKAVPYGVYDVGGNAGWVASASPRHGRVRGHCDPHLDRADRGQRYPHMRELTITADCGGSNGACRLWKVELQKLADETGLTLRVRHYPPGTSKWNKIEHRMFCHITQNWRGRPLESRIAVVELIGATTTKTGLKIECALDERTYEKGIKVNDAEMSCLDIRGDTFHPEWNYAIKPRRSDLRSGYRCGCPKLRWPSVMTSYSFSNWSAAFAEGLLFLRSPRARLTAQGQIPVLGELLRLGQLLFLRRAAVLAAIDRGRAMPELAAPFVDLNQAAEDLVTEHDRNSRTPLARAVEYAFVLASVLGTLRLG